MSENLRIGIGVASSLLAALVIGGMTTPYMGMATASYGVLLTGVFATRRGGPLHRLLMSVGVGADLLQVLWIEFSRSAIAETVRLELPLLPFLHVLTSATAVVIYAPALWFGWKAYGEKAESKARRIHRNLGIAALAFRSIGYLLMFSLLPFLAMRASNP
jgi:hypothetical protein